MILEISPNKLCQESQEINFSEHLLTFIGENGCGKSSILESIFQRSLQSENDQTVVCFSSGQNESYSKFYFPFINEARNIVRIRDEEQSLLALDEINTFYFDYDWSKFLIFFASILKKDGLVREVLTGKYIDVNRQKEDVSSILNLSIEVGLVYVNRINQSLRSEEIDPTVPTLRKTDFHNQLSRLIELKIDSTYEFDKPLRKSAFDLTYNDVVNFFKKDSYSILKFLSIASNNNYFINIKESDLIFRNGIKLKDLSDGEYQMLVVYSIIDLFDSPNTLFLLDEVDSHLYYKNLEKLWDILKNQTVGKVITTSHLADSIVLNNVDCIKLINLGKIDNNGKLNDLLERLDKLTDGEDKKKKIASKVDYLALVEDKTDWIIFTELAKKRLGPIYDSVKMEKIHIIKCSGGYDKDGDDFGGSRKQWVKEFSKCSDIATKEIFLICDRDVLPIGNMLSLNDPKAIRFPQSQIEIIGTPKKNLPNFVSDKKFPHLLSWRRREIENYLFTHTVLTSFSLFGQISQKLGEDGIPLPNQTMDRSDSIRDRDLKPLLASLLYKPKDETSYDIGRWDYSNLRRVIDCIPATEVSDDIVNMYTFIVSKIN
jgi:ABC-type multidrug transport system ATPase subunit